MNSLSTKLFEICGNFKIGRNVTRTVKYVNDLVLLAKKTVVLRGVIGRLIGIGRWYGMEMDVEKN